MKPRFICFLENLQENLISFFLSSKQIIPFPFFEADEKIT